jgi:hypothetical protein
MPSLAESRTYLTIIQIVGYLLLLRKLFAAKLFDKYWYFGLLIIAEAVRMAVLAVIPLRSDLYAQAYFVSAPIIWVLFVLVVLEFFQLIAGIASLGRKALSFALICSALVSVATLLVDLQHSPTESALLFNFMLLERLVSTSLLVLLLSLIVFTSYFPIPVARNLRVHACVFAVYFTVRTAMFFIRLIFGLDVVDTVNLAFRLLGIASVYAWIVLLSPSGELAPVRHTRTASEERLLAQLEAINESLMRSARK